MTNLDLVITYVKGNEPYNACNHSGFTLEKFWNYSTLMCTLDRKTKVARLNVRKYGTSTRKIQNMLREELAYNGFKIVEYIGEYANPWNGGVCGAAHYVKSDFAI